MISFFLFDSDISLPHLQMWLFLCLKFNNQRKFLMNSVLIQPNPARTNIHVQRPRLTHPKRLAETKHMTQDEWLEVRRKGIGSSDCAAACGLNPYMSMLELWM